MNSLFKGERLLTGQNLFFCFENTQKIIIKQRINTLNIFVTKITRILFDVQTPTVFFNMANYLKWSLVFFFFGFRI